jgi:Bacterial archaeo-eukaryotic release factor family 2
VKLTFVRPLYAHAGGNADTMAGKNAGGFASVYLDTSGTGRGPQAKAVEIRWRDLREELSLAGVDPATLDALGDVLTGAGLTAPGTAAFGQDGTVPLAVRLPAVPLREMARWARLPDLLPLLIQSPPRPPHLLVSATRAGGDVLAIRTADDLARRRVEGTGWPVHKTKSGGWAQLEHQRAAEEAWETNAKELAGTVVSAAAGGVPEAIIVAGDVRAREMLVDKLPTNLASKAVIVDREVPVDSPELAAAAEQVLRQLEDADCRRRLETFRSRLGAGGAAEGLAETVAALRDGQVSELFLGGDYLAGDPDTPGPDWSSAPAWIGPALADVGLSAEDLRERGLTEVARDRADAAIVRAVTGTDAELFMVPAGERALRDDIGALLRYPVPGA